MKLRKAYDFSVEDHGDIVILFPVSHFGILWLKKNIEPWYREGGVDVDKRLFFGEIKNDMEDEGMTLQWSNIVTAA